MDIFISILLLLVFSRLLGEFMERIGQFALVGEILAGAIIGVSLLNLVVYDPNKLNDFFKSGQTAEYNLNYGLNLISELGFMFFMFYAGLEMRPEEIKGSVKKSMFISWFDWIIPFSLGFGLGHYFGYDIYASLILGVCMSLTALAISVRILMDAKKLNTDVGKTIVTTTVISDIIALIAMSVVFGVADSKSSINLYSVGIMVGKVMIFIAIFLFAEWILRHNYGIISIYFTHYLRKFRSREAWFAVPLMITICFALLAQALGLHFVIGGFFAGLLFHKNSIGEESFKKLSTATSAITMGFLAPVFFAGIGLQFNIHVFENTKNITFLILMLTFAILGKYLGGFFGAKISNFNNKDASLIGVLMNGRGAIEIVIAAIAYQKGIIPIQLFSALIIMGFLTTLMTPIIVRRMVKIE